MSISEKYCGKHPCGIPRPEDRDVGRSPGRDDGGRRGDRDTTVPGVTACTSYTGGFTGGGYSRLETKGTDPAADTPTCKLSIHIKMRHVSSSFQIESLLLPL